MRGTPQTRDHLTDVLWPDSMPDAARKNLRNTLWTIRKALDGDVLTQSDADRLALSGAVWVDVHAFQAAAGSPPAGEGPTVDQLQEAIDLYRARFSTASCCPMS